MSGDARREQVRVAASAPSTSATEHPVVLRWSEVRAQRSAPGRRRRYAGPRRPASCPNKHDAVDRPRGHVLQEAQLGGALPVRAADQRAVAVPDQRVVPARARPSGRTGLAMSGTISATVSVRRVRMLRGDRRRPVPDLRDRLTHPLRRRRRHRPPPLSTCDTVVVLTPARAATSLIVALPRTATPSHLVCKSIYANRFASLAQLARAHRLSTVRDRPGPLTPDRPSSRRGSTRRARTQLICAGSARARTRPCSRAAELGGHGVPAQDGVQQRLVLLGGHRRSAWV